MSTRSSYFLIGPFHLYHETKDGWIHLALGDGYPRFAPKILPAWRPLDKVLYGIFVELPWKLWGRRHFRASKRFHGLDE